MPKFTKKLQLPYFYYGEQYSAYFDKLRFSSIDNYFNGLSSSIGNGIVDGFAVNVLSEEILLVSSGRAILSKIYSENRCDLEINYAKIDGAKIKIRNKAKKEFNNELVGNIKYINYLDIVNPSSPISVKADEIDYYKVKISWSIADGDVSYVNVYRDNYDDGVEDFYRASLVESSEDNIFIDSDVLPGSKYIYYFESYDINGNKSDYYSSLIINVPYDNVAPDPPKYFSVISGNSRVQLIWVNPSYKNISGYEIYYSEIDSVYSVVGDPVTISVDKVTNNYIIDELKPNTRYKISIRSYSSSGKYSIYQDKLVTTKEYILSDTINFISYESFIFDKTIFFDIFWDFNIDPYESQDTESGILYKCKVYELDDLNKIYKTSEYIQVYSNKIRLSGMPVVESGSNKEIIVPFNEKNRYLFGVFRISVNEISSGTYVYMNPKNFLPPDGPSLVSLNLNEDKSLGVVVVPPSVNNDVSITDLSLYESKIINKIFDYSEVSVNPGIEFRMRSIGYLNTGNASVPLQIPFEDLQELFLFTLTDSYLLVEFDFDYYQSIIDIFNIRINGQDFSSKWPLDGVKINFSSNEKISIFFQKVVTALNRIWFSVSGIATYRFTDIFSIDLISNSVSSADCSLFVKFNKKKASLNSRNNSAIINDSSSSNISVSLDWAYPEELNKIKIIYNFQPEEKIFRIRLRGSYSTNISSYIIRPGYKYSIDAKFIDYSGNESEAKRGDIITPMFDELQVPSSPVSQSGYFMHNKIMLSWGHPQDGNILYYKIYKKVLSGISSIIDLGLIARLKYDNLSYYDYDIEPGKSYYYIITSVDIWGRESASYEKASQFYSTGVITVPFFSNDINFDFQLSRSGNDLLISWENLSNISGDGVEILCRRPDKNEFKTIYNSIYDKEEDLVKNIFLENGLYAFGIRVIYNQIEPFVDYSGDIEGLEIAELQYKFNILKVVDKRRILLNLESPIIEETNRFLISHNHLLTDEIDKRVDLSEVYRVSDWIPSDDTNSKFYSNSNFPENYTGIEVYLNQLKNVILYEFNYEKKTLYFSKSLWPRSGEAFNPNTHVFTSIVDIDLIFLGFSETTNNLEYNKIGDIFAEQFDKGILDINRIEQIEHSGRINEKLVPFACLCETDDGYKYIISRNEENKIRFISGSSVYEVSDYGDNISEIPSDAQMIGFDAYEDIVNCYDMIVLNGYAKKIFFFGCSNKIYYATDITNLKHIQLSESVSPFDFGPSIKLFYFSIQNKNIIVSIHPRGLAIYEILSYNSLIDDIEISNIYNSFVNGVNFCHDLMLYDGNMYLSTNIGLFKIKISFDGSGINSLYAVNIEQMPVISLRSNEVFGSFVAGGEIYASTKNGVYKYLSSFNTWSLFETLVNNDIIHKIIKMANYTLAIGKIGIYRIDNISGSIKNIYNFEEEQIQSAVIYQERMILSTDKNIYISVYGSSLEFSNRLVFKLFASHLKYNGKYTITYSLKSDYQGYGNDYIYFCQEGRVCRASSLSRFSTLIDFHINKSGRDKFNVPSYYLNGILYESGIFFQNKGSSSEKRNHCCIYSKYQNSLSDELKIIREYKKFNAINGGWAFHDFASPVLVKLNGKNINDGSRAEKPYSDINNILNLNLNNFDDRISNFILLNSNFNNLYNHVNYMTINTENAAKEVTERGIHRFTRNNVRKLIFYINKVNSSIYSPEITQDMGIYNSLYLPYPTFKVYLLANVYDGTDGYTGVDLDFLDSLGINYSNYSIAAREGSLCTYDPEDKSYYLPSNIPLKEVCSSSLTPNYDISINDLSFGLSDDISALSDYFTSIIPEGGSASTIVGRNRGGSDGGTAPPGGAIGDGSGSGSGGGSGGGIGAG